MQPKRIYDVSEISYLWQLENLYLAGQPGPKTFLELKERGVKRVVNLRDASEGDFSFEEKLCRELGMEYVQFPIIVGGRLSVENCQRLNKMMEENKDMKVEDWVSDVLDVEEYQFKSEYKGFFIWEK